LSPIRRHSIAPSQLLFSLSVEEEEEEEKDDREQSGIVEEDAVVAEASITDVNADVANAQVERGVYI